MPIPGPVGWLFDLLGVSTLFDGLNVGYPSRAQLRFIGATLADNPTLGTTDVTIGGAVVKGLTTTGAHVYDPDSTSHVWNRSAVTAGCVWKLGAHTLRQSIRVSSFHTANALAIQDPTGNVLGSLLYTSGNTYSLDINFDGSTWNIVDQKVKP